MKLIRFQLPGPLPAILCFLALCLAGLPASPWLHAAPTSQESAEDPGAMESIKDQFSVWGQKAKAKKKAFDVQREIKKLEKELDTLYSRLGERVYTLIRQQESAVSTHPDIVQLAGDIDDKKLEIQMREDQLDSIEKEGGGETETREEPKNK